MAARYVAQRAVTARDGVSLAVHEWHLGAQSEPAVQMVLAHGTGFHGHCWDAALRRMHSSVRAFSIDMRGHGHSESPPPPYPWQSFSHDVADVCAAFGTSSAPLIGVGHSKGAYSIARAASEDPSLFSAVVLVDPVIFPAWVYAFPEFFGSAHFAQKRRRHFASAEAMEAALGSKGLYAAWDREAVRDYCAHGLRSTASDSGSGSGRLELACAPEVEASIYLTSTQPEANIRDQLARITCPVTLVRARAAFPPDPPQGSDAGGVAAMDMTGSPTDPHLAVCFTGAPLTEIVRADLSHCIPMEAPRTTAEILDAAAARCVGEGARL